MQAAEHDGGGAETDRPRATRRLRLLVASAFVVGVSVVGVTAGSAGAEHATSHTDASAYVLSDVHCSPRGDGVLDLTLVNDSDVVDAEFTVHSSTVTTSSSVLVAPASAHALAYTGLPDGEVDVPVYVDGAVQLVHAVVDCDLPRLTARLSAAAVQGSAAVSTPELPRTGGDSGGLVIGGLLVFAGIVASLFARRRYS